MASLSNMYSPTNSLTFAPSKLPMVTSHSLLSLTHGEPLTYNRDKLVLLITSFSSWVMLTKVSAHSKAALSRGGRLTSLDAS